jgi:hypothetical protein
MMAPFVLVTALFFLGSLPNNFPELQERSKVRKIVDATENVQHTNVSQVLVE